MHKTPDPKSYEFFLATWQVYRKIVDHNYMYHREIFSEILKILGEGKRDTATILDLGCGDAGTVRPILEKIPFANYVGVDASQPALELAKNELKSFENRIRLECMDMLSFLMESPPKEYEVILVSFSLHHFETEQKRDFLALCKNRLALSGQLIVVDVFRNERQSREDYLEEYCGDMANRWAALTADERQIALEHVRTHDFPETLEDFLLLAKGTGLRDQGGFLRHGFHAITSFAR